jgi:hypothetical protein
MINTKDAQIKNEVLKIFIENEIYINAFELMGALIVLQMVSFKNNELKRIRLHNHPEVYQNNIIFSEIFWDEYDQYELKKITNYIPTSFNLLSEDEKEIIHTITLAIISKFNVKQLRKIVFCKCFKGSVLEKVIQESRSLNYMDKAFYYFDQTLINHSN